MHILSEHIGALLIGEEYGDVTFVVEKKRFPAHRVILAARCQYFRALLYGGMRESQPEAEILLKTPLQKHSQCCLNTSTLGGRR